MLKINKFNPLTKISVILFLILSVWWIVLYASGLKEDFHNYLFAASYGLMALLGGIWGFNSADAWGGSKSIMGKAIIFLSLGLLAQEIGQLVFSFYNIYLNVEVPYPSIADIGFFGNIPLYIYGCIFLLKASSGRISFKAVVSQMQTFLIPLFMLSISYFLFLKNYEFDWSNSLKILLDFGYPLGQALYVSLAILTYSLSKKMLGGIMKNKIMLILIAFIMQYIADSNFLYQSATGTWQNGGYGDYLYLVAYFVMTLGLAGLTAGSIRSRLD